MPRPAKRKARNAADASVSRKTRRIRGNSKPDQKPSCSFCSLPEELLLEIFDFFIGGVYGRSHVHTLYNLCLTSRQLYRLAKPYLYSLVDNRIVDPRKLLRTLIHQPCMAERVKDLLWFDDHRDFNLNLKNHNQQYKLTHTERRELCKKVETLGLLDARTHSRSFQLQKPNDNLAALLLLTPQIRSLDICDTNVCCHPTGYSIAPTWVRILGEAGLCAPEPLSDHFKHLSIISIRMGPLRLLHILPIMRIRSLRTLMLEDLFQGGPIHQRLWDLAVGQRSSPLEDLYVENSFIDSQALAQLIRSIQGLKRFCFEFDDAVRNGVYARYEAEIPELHYPTIAAAILEHKDTLEHLGILDSADPDIHKFARVKPGSLGSLRDLHKLRSLQIDLACFGGVDEDMESLSLDAPVSTRPADLSNNIPCGVQTLDLNMERFEDRTPEYETFWRQCLTEFAKTCKPTLPELYQLALYRKDLKGFVYDDEFKGIHKAFAEQGVLMDFAWSLGGLKGYSDEDEGEYEVDQGEYENVEPWYVNLGFGPFPGTM